MIRPTVYDTTIHIHMYIVLYVQNVFTYTCVLLYVEYVEDNNFIGLVKQMINLHTRK